VALDAVNAAITARLRMIPGITQGPDAPPAQLADDRMLIVYPRPGISSPFSHGGKHGQAVVKNEDFVIVEWHLKGGMDQAQAFIDTGTPMFVAVREAIWSEFLRNNFDGTVTLLGPITTEDFGQMGWGDRSDLGLPARHRRHGNGRDTGGAERMTATALTIITVPGFTATSGLALTWTAGDVAHGNTYKATGRELVMVRNVSVDTARHLTVDATGAHVADYVETVAFGAYRVLPFLPLRDFQQTDRTVLLTADSDDLQLVVLRLPT
jgi:hypothetical protein